MYVHIYMGVWFPHPIAALAAASSVSKSSASNLGASDLGVSNLGASNLGAASALGSASAPPVTAAAPPAPDATVRSMAELASVVAERKLSTKAASASCGIKV